MSDQKSTPAWKLIFIAWRALLQSREALLIKHYRETADALGAPMGDVHTLVEARQRFIEALPHQSRPSETEIERLEIKIVWGNRIVTLWLVFWTTVVPTLLAAACLLKLEPLIPVLALRSEAGQAISFESVILRALFLSSLFYIFYLGSLILQGLLVRPFVSFVNRVLEVPSEHR